MSPRELRLRQRIDDLIAERDELRRALRALQKNRARWRLKAGKRINAPRGQGRARYRECPECGDRCRGVRCLPCAKATGTFGKRAVA